MKLNKFLTLLIVLVLLFVGCEQPGSSDSTQREVSSTEDKIVTGITINGGIVMGGVSGVTKRLTASVVPSDATVKTVTWSSSDESLLTVSSDGVVTSQTTVVTDTNVTITATATDGSGISVTHVVTLQYVDTTSSVVISKSQGWFESAFIEWTPLAGAASYNVYYQKSGDSAWTQIDTQLIRSYDTYIRGDILGLAQGDYSVKVVACVDDENEFSGSSTTDVTVTSHDRTGFAFLGSTVPGAYSDDGTLKANANVIYVTENSKDTVSLTVQGATENPCVGINDILLGYKKGDETKPLVVRVIGNVTDPLETDKGDLVIENDNGTTGITFEGVGNDATANGWGLRIKNSDYIEVRNIGFMNCNSSEGDDVGLQQGNNYVWVHHNDFFYGDAGSDSDQAKGDGALDTKKSNYITMSYNHFWDSGKSNLVGLSEDVKSYETGAFYVTFHHNWYDHSDSRHPRVRFYNAHIYNNYYDGNAKYGAGSTLGSSLFVQNNYFRNVKNPMMISMQGTDVYSSGSVRDISDNPTFSKEDGGVIKAYGNYMTGTYYYLPYNSTNSRGIDTTVDFDSYEVANVTDAVPASITSYNGANYYSNFDTNGTALTMYTWTPDTAEDAMTKVTQNAGRLEGGDLTWAFDNSVDDTSYAVNVGLKAALTSYATTIVSIQGDEVSSNGSDGDTNGDTPDEEVELPEGTVSVTFDDHVNGTTTNNGVTITGNLKSGITAKSYDGVTYTTALKMESSTSIAFTSAASVTVTLVFDTAAKGVYIDGTKYTSDANGVVSTTVAAQEHTITKGDSMNLYTLIIEP